MNMSIVCFQKENIEPEEITKLRKSSTFFCIDRSAGNWSFFLKFLYTPWNFLLHFLKKYDYMKINFDEK